MMTFLWRPRVLAVADVAESMASPRPYRPALAIEAALEDIENNKGVFQARPGGNMPPALPREGIPPRRGMSRVATAGAGGYLPRRRLGYDQS